MYARGFGLAALVAILFAPFAFTSAAERWPCIRVGEGESELRIHATLDAQTELDFDDTPLQDVVAYLGEFHKIPIIVDARALSEQGLGPDAPVTAHFNAISLRSALRMMLRDLGLDYVIRDEVLQITTPDMASNNTPVCLFDISQLAPNPGDADLLLAAVQSHANRYSVQISMFRNVLVVKGNQQHQDDIGAFLAALFQAQAQQIPGAAEAGAQ